MIVFFWSVLLFKVGSAAFGQEPSPVFHSPPQSVNSSGHFKISWQSRSASAEDIWYRLESSRLKDFSRVQAVYEGPETSTFLSGLENGGYFFRVNADGGAWSETVLVEVKHFDSSLAIMLFLIGLFTFAGIIGVILHGNSKFG